MTPGERGSRPDELRLRRFYESDRFRKRHDPARAGNRYLFERRTGAIVEALGTAAGGGGGARYLEVGCERGAVLCVVGESGRWAGRLFGVDRVLDWLIEGKGKDTKAPVACADASRLPFPDGTFDVVGQYMMLSSVTDRGTRCAIGRELLRVLRPTGSILSLDLRYPRVPPVGRIALTRSELARIFPGADIRYRTCVLLPPLARWLAPLSAGACDLLARLPPLRAYHIASVRPVS